MANDSFKVKKSLNLEPIAGAAPTAEGDITYDSTAHKASIYNGTSASPLVTEGHTATLSGKTLSSPTLSGTTTTPLTASRAMVTGSSSELAISATTATELGYVNGVTSAIQTQINTKAPAASPTFSGTITTPLTASRAVVTGASSELAAATTTATEIGYVNGVTSAIQTQLDAKVAKSTATTKGDIFVATASATVARQGIGTDGHALIADSAQTNGLKWAAIAVSPTAPTAVKTSTYSIGASDDLVLVDGTSAFTATLPTAVGVSGKVYTIKRTDQTLANAVTIATTSSQTIDGVTTRKLMTQYEAFKVESDGANWHILEHHYPKGWNSYTPTLTGFGTTSSVTGNWKRVGDSVMIRITFTQGTPTAVAAKASLPSGLTFTNMSASNELVGYWTTGTATIASAATVITDNSDTSNLKFSRQDGSIAGLSPQNATAIFSGSSAVNSLYATVQIANWEA